MKKYINAYGKTTVVKEPVIDYKAQLDEVKKSLDAYVNEVKTRTEIFDRRNAEARDTIDHLKWQLVKAEQAIVEFADRNRILTEKYNALAKVNNGA